ncbi:MAG: HDIG domain-containing protein [Vallitalea sp.]|jgi:putative nucleotidyltransferase with HDIG domain|nr:HDIG domain-containing protein [Vallitalea sp.]
MPTKKKGSKVNLLTIFIAIITGLATIISVLVALNSNNTYKNIGIAGFIVLLFVLLYIYIYYYNRTFFKYKNKTLLYTCIYIIVMVPVVFMNKLPYLLIPIPIAGMLIAMMIDNRLGIITNLVLTIVGLLVSGNGIEFFIFYVISGSLACLVISQAKKRNKIVFISAFLVIINVILVLLINLYKYGSLTNLQLTDIFYGILNSIFSVIITIGSLPLWETLFDVATPVKLLELTNSDHKLMQRLLIEAPGTYHHSQMVSNLAQTAANDIGCNALLAKTGALYHDIGKLKNPIYFTENQNGVNPHDDLDPISSAKIIINHVDYGVKLATENHLPKPIRSIIKQHHGNTLVKYFYHEAKENSDGFVVDENEFKYNGPKPQTNEAAIIMLADCVEAYVRALPESKRTLTNIEVCIDEIINNKFQEGQLNECNLKIKELPIIGYSFMKVYNGLYHERVEYPNDKGEDEVVNNNK